MMYKTSYLLSYKGKQTKKNKMTKLEFSAFMFLCLCACLRLTLCFAGFGNGIHLITLVAFALIIPLVVDADLTAGVRVLTLVNVCGEEERKAAVIHGHAILKVLKKQKPCTGVDTGC